jgi:hypothetical protein
MKRLSLALGLSVIALLFNAMDAAAGSGLTLKFDLESKIRDKVKALVEPLDPDAQIAVTIAQNTISTELPGASVSVSNFLSSSESGSLAATDIQSVDLRVYTRLDDVPQSLRDIISRELKIAGVKINVNFEKMDPAIIAAIDARKNEIKPAVIAEEIAKLTARGDKSLMAVYVLAGVIAVSVLGMALILRRSVSHEMARMTQAMTASAEGISAGGAMARVGGQGASGGNLLAPERGAQSATFEDSEREVIQSFGSETLTALLSDCYWCEMDRYAIWLWSRMSPSQRTDVLQRWKFAEAYVRTLEGEGVYHGYHNHPYYLRPLPSWDVSQEDLVQWVRKKAGAWHFMSPMRQERLSLPLFERLAFTRAESPAEAPALPPPTQSARKISAQLRVIDISEADELAILNDPGRIPIEMREHVPSLVWLALVDDKVRTDILSKLSAQQIAQAWIGPQAVKDKVASSIAEKKLRLVQDYATRLPGDRRSEVMKFIVNESLKSHALIEPSQDPVEGPKNVA